jgi:serine/threonine-protein kinase HipA
MKPGERRFVLAEAYDLLPVNVIMPEDKEEFALSLNGKKRNIRRKDFLIFAENCAIPRKSAENMMKKLARMEADFIKACDESWMPVEMQESMKRLIEKRMEVLRM